MLQIATASTKPAIWVATPATTRPAASAAYPIVIARNGAGCQPRRTRWLITITAAETDSSQPHHEQSAVTPRRAGRPRNSGWRPDRRHHRKDQRGRCHGRDQTVYEGWAGGLAAGLALALSSDQGGRLGVCGADPCDRVYTDTSRNGGRRFVPQPGAGGPRGAGNNPAATTVAAYMRIDIWSDVVCPWCYIGKRRLETALSTFRHAEDVEVVWHSYQLDPGAPTTPVETIAERLGRKYGGGPAAGGQMIDRVEAVAAEEGMLWRLHEAKGVGTMDAHRLLHLALEEGGPELQGRVKEALLAAYFTDARNVADHDELRAIVTGAGVDHASVDRVLGSTEHADEVWADIERAQALGVSGVPFVVVDDKFGVSGAQPVEVFEQVLARAWSSSHPTLELVAEGDACGPDGCAV